MLAGRELPEAKIRERLGRRELPPDAIEAAIDRLRRTGAIDDRRTALAYARIESRIRRRGPDRIIRQLQAAGIDRETAGHAVREVFREVDQGALLEEALSRRLGGRALDADDRPECRRLFAYLVRQGFAPDAVAGVLTDRRKAARGVRRASDLDI